MLKPGKNYKELFESFQWQVPEFYNIGVDICDKWADEPDRTALIYEDHEGRISEYKFAQLKRLSNQLANGLMVHGIQKGDRIGIFLGQCPETAITHIAAYKIGAVAIPLFTLFGTDALEYRLSNSAASAVVTDGPNLAKVLEIRDKLPDLRLVPVISGETPEGVNDFWQLLEKGADQFQPAKTRADDPALIIYTSGTTGPPKGALHAHRVVLGHLPGVEFPHNLFPREGDRFWTPG